MTTSKADPPDWGPHCTQEGQPEFQCDISPQSEIISIVMIPTVSSGAVWMLSLQNFLSTCKTQVHRVLSPPIVWRWCVSHFVCTPIYIWVS